MPPAPGAAQDSTRRVPVWAGAALLAALVLLFLIANRGAYQGYFSGDDLNNLSWTRHGSLASFLPDLLSPRFFENNYRPLGHLFFAVLGRTAGLEFRWYVLAMHLLHFVNVWLVWRLARRLGLKAAAATAGALFFAFHVAVFDACWKPMYVFDVLCALLCLVSLLAYTHRRWVLSLLLFWLAYKTKEVAVMLPAVLLLYEYWLGERRWKRLAPFFAVSLLFGLQALAAARGVRTDYALRIGLEAQWHTLAFYSSQVLLVPWLGLALAALPLLVRDRRLYWGLASLGLLLAPMLLLPGRLFGAYLYLPLAGAAVALAAIVERARTARAAGLTILCFALWITWNYAQLRTKRRAALTEAAESRAYVAALQAHRALLSPARTVIYDAAPESLHSWGIEGAVRYLHPSGKVEVLPLEDPRAQQALQGDAFAVLNWDAGQRELLVLAREPGAPAASWFEMRRNPRQPFWQLEEGWTGWAYLFRWTRPYARARLWRPARARWFEVVVHVGPQQIRDLGRTRLEVSVDGQRLGPREFTAAVIQTVRWELPPGAASVARIEFHAAPEYRPTPAAAPLGIPIAAFGFVEEPSP